MTWKSTLSKSFDFVCGLLPAVFFGCWALIGTVVSLIYLTSSDSIVTSLLLLGVSSVGWIACISLGIVLTTREKTVNKVLHIIFLVTGIIILVPVIFIVLTQQNFDNTLYLLLPFSAISLVFVAIKSIFLLSRASEVQP